MITHVVILFQEEFIIIIIPVSMLSEKVDIRNARYYEIVNKKMNKALYVSSGATDYQSQKILLDTPEQKSLGQAWQIFRVDPQGNRRPNCFEFVHSRSTLVLTILKDQFVLKKFLNKSENREMRLRFGNWENTQLFYLEQPDPEDHPNIYRFRSYENTERPEYIVYDRILKCEAMDPTDQRCHWEIRPCYNNDIINRSCYLQNAFSGLVIDVPAGSHKDGCKLIQYPLNNRFNQRFNIYKSGRFFKIGNLNSKLFVTVDKKGTEVAQKKQCDELFQMWSIEYQSKNIFLIRSAMNEDLLLGIRQNSLKHEDNLIMTTQENFGLWKIIGFIPQ